MFVTRRWAIASILMAFLLAAPLALSGAPPAVAGEQDGTPYGENFTFHKHGDRFTPWSGPQCDNRKVLERVRLRFAETEEAYWQSGLIISHVGLPREVSHRHWDPALIASRSCEAQAELNDGRHVALVYRIRSEQGFAGFSWGVDYCIVGDDPTYSYQPGCRGLIRR
jgi:hypothetical protein